MIRKDASNPRTVVEPSHANGEITSTVEPKAAARPWSFVRSLFSRLTSVREA